MSKHKEIIHSINRIWEYTAEDICRTLSLALDIPELFNISDTDLLLALREHEGLLEFTSVTHTPNIDEEDTEEDTY